MVGKFSSIGAVPQTVVNGGTGAATLTGVLIGNGTSAVTGQAVTQHDVLVGGASNAITSVAPSATSGVALVSGGASADPSFSTVVVAGGGTGAVSLTGLLVGNGTSPVTTDSYSAAASFTPAFSLATAGDSAWTYSTRVGRWQRLGALVYFQAQLVWTSFSNTTGSGNWQFNVPAAAGAFVLAGQITITGTGVIAVPANSLPIYGSVASGASIGTIFTEGNSKIAVDATGVSQVNTLVLANVGNAGTLNIMGFYFAA